MGLPRVFASARSIKTFFVLLWGSACYTAPLVGLTGKEVFIYGGKRIVRAEHPSRGAEQRGKQACALLLLHDDLEVLVDDRNRHQDPRTRSNCTDNIREDRQQADAHSTARCRDRNVPVQHIHRGGVAVARNEGALVLEFLGNVLRRRPGDVNPEAREHRRRRDDEQNVAETVNRVLEETRQRAWRRDVVHHSADRDRLPGVVSLLPLAQQIDEHVRLEALVQKLREEVRVRDEGRLQDHRRVRGVEQLDGVRVLRAAHLRAAHGQVNPEALEVDDNEEYQQCREQVGEIRRVPAVERFFQGRNLVRPRDEQVEEGNDRTLELAAFRALDHGRRKSAPHHRLADRGRDEEGDRRAEPVPLLEKFVEHDDDHAGEEELDDNQDRVSRAELFEVAVHTGHNVRDCLDDGDEQADKLLRTLEELLVLLVAVVHLEHLDTRQQLHNHSRGDDWRDTKLHQSAAVGCKDHAHPVERIGGAGAEHAVERDLRADQVDEQGNDRPQHLLPERHFPLRRLHLREDAHDRLQHLQEGRLPHHACKGRPLLNCQLE